MTRQKHHAYGDITGSMRALTDALKLAIEERVRNGAQDASAVTTLAIGIECATVRQPFKTFERIIQNLVRIAAGEIRHDAHTAGIMFKTAVIERRVCGGIKCRACGVRLIMSDDCMGRVC
jgi:hypothetical protein